MLAIVYADFFRGVPTILVITLLGFGMPALGLVVGADLDDVLGDRRARPRLHRVRLRGLPRRDRVRAPEPGRGRALARARRTLQGLRYVIVPQAVRRVIPPLLNDFIGLQKDTALVGVLGAIEAFKQAQIDQAATFNFTLVRRRRASSSSRSRSR